MARKPPHTLAAVVMAAGKGKRLRSRIPKVLHELCGRPVLWHVLDALRAAKPGRVVVVVGHGRDEVEEAVRSWKLDLPIQFAHQEEPLGTGHAVMTAERLAGKSEELLVLAGDEPLVTGQQLRELIRLRRRGDAAAVVQTTVPSDPKGFTSVVREGDRFVRLEDRPPAGERVEVATSAYAFRREDLFGALPLLNRENRQGEYYLFEVLNILRDKGERIGVQVVDNGGSVGANSRAEMAEAEAVMRRRINTRLMDRGVRMTDPERTYVDTRVRVGQDTLLRAGTHLAGETAIGRDCVIGPSALIEDTRIGDGARVEFSVVRGSRIGSEATVGPYAHIRPGTVLGRGAKAGSFVEIKGSTIGEGSKVPHLSYVGDATIGRNVNVGAGTVTVNYDGYEKHRTVIGDDVRLGSDTMLVAPVRVGKGAVTGAGSVITKDVPPGALAVERAEQRTIRGYRRRKDAERRKGKGEGEA